MIYIPPRRRLIASMSGFFGGGGGQGLPNGGNAGDVLTKHTILNGDADWLPASPALAIGAPVLLGTGNGLGPGGIPIVTVADAPAGGAIVLAMFSEVARLDAATAVADTAANTYAVTAPPGGSNRACYWAEALNIAHLALGDTITVTLGRPGGGNGSLAVAFYIPGVAHAAAVDANVNVPDVHAHGQTLASGVLADPLEIVLACIGTPSGDVTGAYNTVSPFAKIGEITAAQGGQVDYMGAFYALVAGTASINAAMTPTNPPAVDSGAAILSLKSL